MEYRSKYKAEEIEAILDAKNNDGAGVDANLDGLFTDALQTKEVEVSEDTTIKADEGFLGLKEVSVKVSGGGSGGSNIEYLDVSGMNEDNKSVLIMYALQLKLTGENVVLGTQIVSNGVYSFIGAMPSVVTAISIDMTMPMTKYMSSGQGDKQELTTLEEAGISIFTDNLPRLTEEEFYTL